jgi:pimeloyl-ACP methyl ester carboxylesterase
MTPSAKELEQHYNELQVPVVIVTGAEDQVADVGRQSQRLHRELPGSELIVIPSLGHLFHHLAPDQLVAAIDRVAHEREIAA